MEVVGRPPRPALGTLISRSSVLVLQGAHDLLQPLPSPLWPGGGDAVVVDIKQTGLHTVQLSAWTAPTGPGFYRAAWSLLLGGCEQCDIVLQLDGEVSASKL